MIAVIYPTPPNPGSATTKCVKHTQIDVIKNSTHWFDLGYSLFDLIFEVMEKDEVSSTLSGGSSTAQFLQRTRNFYLITNSLWHPLKIFEPSSVVGISHMTERK